MGVAAVVGIYAGVAAGLFAQAIRFTQILIFGELAPLLQGPGDRRGGRLLGQGVLASRWQFEFVVLAALLFAFGYAVEWLGEHHKLELPLFEARRVRAVAEAGALGLSLYYPLVVLRAFNGAFDAPEGGLYAMLVRAPRLLWVLAPALGALLAGLLVRYVSPESAGHGVVEVIEAIQVRGHLRGRVALWKALAAGAVSGSGGSAGPEGPGGRHSGPGAAAPGRVLPLPPPPTGPPLPLGRRAGVPPPFPAPVPRPRFPLQIPIPRLCAPP